MIGNRTGGAGNDARTLSQRLRRNVWLARKGLRHRAFPQPLQAHVFVAGMQRSGTNLVMEVLDASYATQVFHETDPRAFERYEMCGHDVIDRLARACPAPLFVIKALCELDRISALMSRYQPSRTLWVVRDWRGSALSATRSFGNFVPQWNRLAHDAGTDGWRGRGMSEATRSLLRELYRADATEFEGAAVMWYYRNVLFFEQSLDRDPRVRVVFYEDLLRNPVEEVKAIYEFIGIPGFMPALAGRVHASRARLRPRPAVGDGVERACDALLARFHAIRDDGAR